MKDEEEIETEGVEENTAPQRYSPVLCGTEHPVKTHPVTERERIEDGEAIAPPLSELWHISKVHEINVDEDSRKIGRSTKVKAHPS